MRRLLLPFVGPAVARRAAELEAETDGLREQVTALEGKIAALVGDLQRLTELLADAAERDPE